MVAKITHVHILQLCAFCVFPTITLCSPLSLFFSPSFSNLAQKVALKFQILSCITFIVNSFNEIVQLYT